MLVWRDTISGAAYYRNETIVAIVYLVGGKYRLCVIPQSQKTTYIGSFNRLDYAKICGETMVDKCA